MSDSVISLPNWAVEVATKDDNGMRRISNSETSAFLSCERKWYYQYVLNLEPNNHSASLSRGIIGHEALAAYYGHLQGCSYPYTETDFDKAEELALLEVGKYFHEAFDVEMLSKLMPLLVDYFAYARGDNWKILAVEREYDVPINDSFSYVMRIDAIVRLPDGRVCLVDHKFVYDFYSQDTLDMNVQLPKYMGALTYNNQSVDVAMLNQIRHRVNKGAMENWAKYRRSFIKPTGAEIRQIMKEQIIASEQIMSLRDASDSVEDKVLRTQNQMTCKNCSMMPLCKADLMGSDTTLMKQIDYKTNTYGYNHPIEETV